MSEKQKTEQEIMEALATKDLKLYSYDRGSNIKITYIDKFEAKKVLDEAFGLNWQFVVEEVQPINDVWYVKSYIEFITPDGRVIKRYGVGSEMINKKGMTRDLTLKAAVSDSFKLAASYVGVALWLYSKSEREANSVSTRGSANSGGTSKSKLRELIKNKKNNTSAANNKANDNANGTGDSSKESIVDKIKRLRAKRG